MGSWLNQVACHAGGTELLRFNSWLKNPFSLQPLRNETTTLTVRVRNVDQVVANIRVAVPSLRIGQGGAGILRVHAHEPSLLRTVIAGVEIIEIVLGIAMLTRELGIEAVRGGLITHRGGAAPRTGSKLFAEQGVVVATDGVTVGVGNQARAANMIWR